MNENHYETKLIKETPIAKKKRKTSLLRLVKKRHKELKKQQVDNYKLGWTFTIEHRGKYQYLYRQKTIDGHHTHVSMRANSWKDLNRKLWYRAQQEIRGECWAGYSLTASELDTYIWIEDYTKKRRRIDASPLLERYRKKLGMRYNSKSKTSSINPRLTIIKIKNILKAARKAIFRASKIVIHRLE
jgi:hypothetical protein